MLRGLKQRFPHRAPEGVHHGGDRLPRPAQQDFHPRDPERGLSFAVSRRTSSPIADTSLDAFAKSRKRPSVSRKRSSDLLEALFRPDLRLGQQDQHVIQLGLFLGQHSHQILASFDAGTQFFSHKLFITPERCRHPCRRPEDDQRAFATPSSALLPGPLSLQVTRVGADTPFSLLLRQALRPLRRARPIVYWAPARRGRVRKLEWTGKTGTHTTVCAGWGAEQRSGAPRQSRCRRDHRPGTATQRATALDPQGGPGTHRTRHPLPARTAHRIDVHRSGVGKTGQKACSNGGRAPEDSPEPTREEDTDYQFNGWRKGSYSP